MSLGAHLIEFRNRLFISAAAIVVGTVAGWFLTDWVWDALRRPINDIGDRVAQITYSDIGSGFPLTGILSHYCGTARQELPIDGSAVHIPALPGLQLQTVSLSSKPPPYSPFRGNPRPGDRPPRDRGRCRAQRRAPCPL